MGGEYMRLDETSMYFMREAIKYLMISGMLGVYLGLMIYKGWNDMEKVIYMIIMFWMYRKIGVIKREIERNKRI
jgi:hypothetical protein